MIFFSFDFPILLKNISEEKLESISKKIGFVSLKKHAPYVRYSQHPYVEAKIKDTKIKLTILCFVH